MSSFRRRRSSCSSAEALFFDPFALARGILARETLPRQEKGVMSPPRRAGVSLGPADPHRPRSRALRPDTRTRGTCDRSAGERSPSRVASSPAGRLRPSLGARQMASSMGGPLFSLHRKKHGRGAGQTVSKNRVWNRARVGRKSSLKLERGFLKGRRRIFSTFTHRERGSGARAALVSCIWGRADVLLPPGALKSHCFAGRASLFRSVAPLSSRRRCPPGASR